MPTGPGRWRIVPVVVVVAAALVIAVAVPSAAAPGRLDPAFGAGGTAVTEFPSSYAGARAVAVQADGRVVAAGFAHTDNTILQDVALVRYDASGELDPTFGSGGRVRTDFGGRFDEALAVAVQPDGRIVVAGSSADATGSDMAVARYLRDGTPDASFDADGMALVDFGGEAVARAVALQRDGKIVLAGWAVQLAGAGCCAADFALARLTASGAPDSSFGGDGRVVTDFLPGVDNGQDAADAVLVQPGGRILAAGSGVTGGSVDFAVARYRGDGSLDPTFGVHGRVTTDFVGDVDEIRDLAAHPTGGIVAGGRSCELPGQSDEVCDFGLVRYTQGGALDRRFGRHGRVRTDLGAEFGEGVRGVVVQRDGRIVAGGETQGPGGFDVGLARYRPDGRLDRGFGVGGVVITPVSSSTDEVGGLVRGPAGQVMVAGTTAVSQGFGFFVSRYRLT
jgi:uncharacterized delta-60 repeat protein